MPGITFGKLNNDFLPFQRPQLISPPCELGTPKFPVFPFLKPNAIIQSLEIWEFLNHGNKLNTCYIFANSAIIFYLKAPLQVLNLTFH